MENKVNEQTDALNTQAVATEKEEGVANGEVSLGKFKDATALLSAYNSLEAEFTKRCQKIKELEGKLEKVDKDLSPTQAKTENSVTPNELSDEEKNNVVKEYLKGVMDRKQKAVLLDGVGYGAKTPVSRPKTITQAGVLAKDIFEK